MAWLRSMLPLLSFVGVRGIAAFVMAIASEQCRAELVLINNKGLGFLPVLFFGSLNFEYWSIWECCDFLRWVNTRCSIRLLLLALYFFLQLLYR